MNQISSCKFGLGPNNQSKLPRQAAAPYVAKLAWFGKRLLITQHCWHWPHKILFVTEMTCHELLYWSHGRVVLQYNHHPCPCGHMPEAPGRVPPKGPSITLSKGPVAVGVHFIRQEVEVLQPARCVSCKRSPWAKIEPGSEGTFKYILSLSIASITSDSDI